MNKLIEIHVITILTSIIIVLSHNNAFPQTRVMFPIFKAQGEIENAWYGRGVGGGGDFNGDGYDDAIVGAQGFDPVKFRKAYVYFGGLEADTIPDKIFSGAGVFGFKVSIKGDYNGDGYNDVVISGADKEVYVYFGSSNPDSIPDLIMSAESDDDLYGWSIASGDVNGDGYDDLAVSAPHYPDPGFERGKIYLYYGGNSMDNRPDWITVGKGDLPGNNFSNIAIGDFNGDGFDDIATGTRGSAAANDDTLGYAFIYLGSAQPDTLPAFTFSESNAAFYPSSFGDFIALSGDFNSDGYDDLAMTARIDTTGGAYIYYGGADPDTIFDLTFKAELRPENQSLGIPVYVGDLGNDSHDDLVLMDAGALGGVGKFQIYMGSRNPDTDVDFTIVGNFEGSFNVSSSAGDFNGDGFGDLIIGDGWFRLGNHRGRVFIFGGNSTLTTSVEAETSNEILPENLFLSQNYPNPFNSSTKILFELPHQGDVSLKVYNITGKEITRLISEVMPEGHHSIIWEGKDSSGREVASGIYIANLLASGVSVSRKLLLLR